jgi:hypothetical protein
MSDTLARLVNYLQDILHLDLIEEQIDDIEEILRPPEDYSGTITPEMREAAELLELAKTNRKLKKLGKKQLKEARFADKLRRMGHPEAAAALMGCSVEELEAKPAPEPTELYGGTITPEQRREMMAARPADLPPPRKPAASLMMSSAGTPK